MRAFIDAHQHLWDPERFSFSWMDGLPSLNVLHGMGEYRDAMQGFAYAGSVYVDTDVDEKDLSGEIAWVFQLAEEPANRILGIVASARLEQGDCFAHLEPHWGSPLLKGVRRVLHTQENSLFLDGQFLENMAALEAPGLSFDICARADQLPLVIDLVRRFPGIQFILDHCGNPVVKQGALEPWLTQMKMLGELDNLVCKLSGLVAHVDAGDWSARTLRPYAGAVIEAFGWERVLWGSDWPVCTLTCSLKRWMDVALELTSDASDEQLDALFGGNARRIYRLEQP